MDDIVKNLKELSSKYKIELGTIQEKLRLLDSIPKAKALDGKCFKHKNGFTFGGSRKGWCYKRIIGVIGENLIVDSFEFEGPNKFEVRFSEMGSIGRFTHPAYKEIKPREYLKQFNKMLKIIKKRGAYGL